VATRGSRASRGSRGALRELYVGHATKVAGGGPGPQGDGSSRIDHQREGRGGTLLESSGAGIGGAHREVERAGGA
jgi:hypothetical protein